MQVNYSSLAGNTSGCGPLFSVNGEKSTVSFDTWNFGKFSTGFLWTGFKGSAQIFSGMPKSERLR